MWKYDNAGLSKRMSTKRAPRLDFLLGFDYRSLNKLLEVNFLFVRVFLNYYFVFILIIFLFLTCKISSLILSFLYLFLTFYSVKFACVNWSLASECNIIRESSFLFEKNGKPFSLFYFILLCRDLYLIIKFFYTFEFLFCNNNQWHSFLRFRAIL